jgi:5-(carboxyamino)imidazole ribonucleotide synthase
MLALAAAQLGLKTHIFAPEADSPAFDVAARQTCASYGDMEALALYASAVDRVTYEFENVPVDTVRWLEAHVPVAPGSRALAVAQDRLQEKRLARTLGAGTAEFAAVDTDADLDTALARIGTPCVLKTTRFGYDGKGQAKIATLGDAPAALAAMRGQPAILEAFIGFAAEVSVVAARTHSGAFAAFDVTENEHRHHILHRSLAPARIGADTANEAIAIAQRIGEALDYVGVFAVEFFVTRAGASEALLVNEIAPRVHNSGHWTLGGTATSQFEQHIRAVAGWPLGATHRLAPEVEMINLIGADVDQVPALLAEPGTDLHLYGKAEVRAGRKMGHITRRLGQGPT